MAQTNAVENLPKFKYQPLEDSQAGIRLLVILPAEPGDDRIVCKLKPVWLSDRRTYEAISYTWGGKSVQIICNGGSFAITDNLAGALRCFRSRAEERAVWADAICINQNDPDEKQHQVQLMGTIYRQAKKTLVWLGPKENDSNKIPSLCTQVNKLLNNPVLRHSLMAGTLLSEEHRGILTHIFDELPDRDGPEWSALRQLLRRRWFRRIWIVQEVALAPEVYVYFGNEQIEWPEFFNLVHFGQASTYLENFGDSGVSDVLSLMLIRGYIRHQHRRPLLSLLLQFPHAQATLKVDKVYGLLGLSDSTLSPRYSPSVTFQEVYKEVAWHLLQTTHTLDILSYPRGQNPRSPDLPSWVPDFYSNDRRIAQLTLQDMGGEDMGVPRFQAAGTVDYTPIISSSDRNLLGIEGQIFDEITNLSDMMDHLRVPTNDAERTELACQSHRVMINWETTAGLRSRQRYIDDSAMEEAFWKTLAAGWYPRGEAYHRELYRRYQQEWTIYRDLHSHGIPCAAFNAHMAATAQHSIGGVAMREFLHSCLAVSGRRMCTTKKGYIGLVPRDARLRDKIVLAKGSKIPLVLRAAGPGSLVPVEGTDGGASWEFVGDIYVHGIMFGNKAEENMFSHMWLR